MSSGQKEICDCLQCCHERGGMTWTESVRRASEERQRDPKRIQSDRERLIDQVRD